MIALLCGVLMVLFQKNEETAPAAAPEVLDVKRPEFVKTITVTVDDRSKMADAINRIKRENTGKMFSADYIIGEPQITSDGLTANISLFKEP